MFSYARELERSDGHLRLLDGTVNLAYFAVNAPPVLEEMYENDGDRISRTWTLYHVLEHLAYHHGQIGLIRRLRSEQAPS